MFYTLSWGKYIVVQIDKFYIHVFHPCLFVESFPFSHEILHIVIFGAPEHVAIDHNLDRLWFYLSGSRKVAFRCLIMCVTGICSTEEIGWDNGAIDFYPLHFMFPQGGGDDHDADADDDDKNDYRHTEGEHASGGPGRDQDDLQGLRTEG